MDIPRDKYVSKAMVGVIRLAMRVNLEDVRGWRGTFGRVREVL